MCSDRPEQLQPCPDLELIAALLDKRLQGAERSRAVEHIADCEACYEIFTESLRSREAEAKPVGTVVRISRRRVSWAAAAVAAVLFTILVIPPVFRSLTSGTSGGLMTTADLSTALARSDRTSEMLNSIYGGEEWSHTRGFGSALSSRQRAFRLGARTIDLDIVLLAGESNRAKQLIHELSDVAEGLPLPEMILVSYEDLMARLDAGEPPRGLAHLSSEAAELISDAAEEPYFRGGQWAEAGLIAARAGDLDFFLSSTAAIPPDLIGADLPSDARASINEIRTILDKKPTPADIPALSEAFRNLVAAGGNL